MVFAAETATEAFAERARLPQGGSFVTRQGHVISKSSVRFYAADAEQDGMLAAPARHREHRPRSCAPRPC